MFGRLRHQQGSAVVMVLMVALIVGALGVAVWQRSGSSAERQTRQANVDRARAGADAALEMALQRIVQIGSTSFDESSCSLLDFPPKVDSKDQPSCDAGASASNRSPTVGGFSRSSSEQDTYTSPEATYRYTIRGSGSTRTITATGIWSPTGDPNDPNAITASKTQKVAITPRALRYGLFASGDRAGGGSALKVTSNGALLLPPTHKTSSAKNTRGSDVGANGSIVVQSGGSVNKREALPTLYADLFGTIGPGQATSAAALGNSTPSVSGDFRVDGAVQRRSNSALPTLDVEGDADSGSFSSLRDLAKAASPLQYFNVDKSADRSALASLLASDQSLTGVLMVENPVGSCPLGDAGVQLTKGLVIKNGALVVYGCNLTVSGAAASLFVDHPLASNASAAEQAANQLPALVVSRNSDDQGGSFTINANAARSASNESAGDGVTLEGASIITGDLTVRADVAAPAGGHLNSNGALVVGGSATIGGGSQTAVVVARWNPLAQELALNPKGLGTYTLKSYDTPSAMPTGTSGVEVQLTQKPPASPADYGGTGLSYTFKWALGDSYEEVTCTLERQSADGSSWTQVSQSECAFLSKTVSGLLLDTVYRFTVKACTIKYGQGSKNDSSNSDLNNKNSTCGSDSATFYVPPTALGISINAKPTATTTATTATFTWTVTGGSAQKPNTFQCKLDSGGWTSCSGGASSASYSSLSAAAYGTDHSFQVKVTNGYSTASDSYSWKVLPSTPPAIQFNTAPANPSAYTQKTASFTWSVSNGMPVGQYQCSLDYAAWATCPNGTLATSYTSGTLNNAAVYGVGHNFKVRGENAAGWTSSPASYSWTIYPDPPGAPNWSTAPPNVDYGYTSSNGSFTSGGGGPANFLCYSSAIGSWVSCSSPYAFAAGGYCSDTYVRVAAQNNTATAYSSQLSFHRNCEPPSMILRWESVNGVNAYGYVDTYNNGTRPMTGWVTSNAYFNYCYYKRSLDGGWNIYDTWNYRTDGCANPFGVSFIGQTSYFGIEAGLHAADNSRTGTFYSQANYYSNGLGFQCVYVLYKANCS